MFDVLTEIPFVIKWWKWILPLGTILLFQGINPHGEMTHLLEGLLCLRWCLNNLSK